MKILFIVILGLVLLAVGNISTQDIHDEERKNNRKKLKKMDRLTIKGREKILM